MAGVGNPLEHTTLCTDAATVILVVASNPDFGDTVARELEREGFGVARAATALDAASRLAPSASPISLVIVDDTTPARTGLTLARELARTSPHVPRIVMASSHDRPGPASTVPDGATRFLLSLPFEAGRLIALVHRTLTHAAATTVERSVGIPLGREAAAPHAAFVDAAAAVDGHAYDTMQLVAGLLILRHIDEWQLGTCRVDELADERNAVRRCIVSPQAAGHGRASDGDLSGSLLAILDALDATPAARFGHIAKHLFALGRRLQRGSQFALATEVYRAVLNGFVAQPVRPTAEDMELAADAALRLGACRRRLSDPLGAQTAYATAIRLAALCDAEHTLLSARLGDAMVVYDLGDLPDADRRIEAVIAATVSERLRTVRADAWHDRAVVAHTRRRYAEAAECLYEAWALRRDDAWVGDGLLADMATALHSAGFRQLARRAHQLLTHERVEPLVRWHALVNLLEIAALDRDESEFERLRAQLGAAPLTPAVEAEYLYHSARGFATFGRVAASRHALDRAVMIAEAHRLNELAMRAAAMRAEGAPVRGTPASTPPLPVGLRPLANALFGEFLLQSVESAAWGERHQQCVDPTRTPPVQSRGAVGEVQATSVTAM
jgi:CheY-like chemotaxis protein/tetratricopeptide (TPR) repeat protein